MTTIENKEYETASEFLTEVNRARLKYKDKWIFCIVLVAGCPVYLKTFNTFIQRYRVSGIDRTPNSQINVTQWKQAILEGLPA